MHLTGAGHPVKAPPNWDPITLQNHVERRKTSNPDCLALRPLDPDFPFRYDARSKTTWQNHRLCYEYDQRASGGWETRRAFVDNDLLYAATDGEERRFITCFHSHRQGEGGACDGGTDLDDREKAQILFSALYHRDWNVQRGARRVPYRSEQEWLEAWQTSP